MESVSWSLVTFLLNSTWQIPLIACVAAFACRMMRNNPASHRHAVWVAALASALLLPIASIRRSEPTNAPVIKTSTTLPASAVQSTGPAAAWTVKPAPQRWTVSLAATTASVVLACYVLFLLYRVLRFVRAGLRTVRIRRSAKAHPMPPLVEKVWTRCRMAFGLDDVQLLVSENLSTPVVLGTRHSYIILPEALFAETSEDLLATAIGHEMAHIARADFALNVFYEVLSIPIAFHPALEWIRKSIERTRELACDELVTKRLIDRNSYARSIVSLAADMSGLARPGHTLGVFDGDILEERLRRLLNHPVENLKRARLALAAGLSAVAVCAVIASGLAFSARAQSAAQNEMKLAGNAYNTGDLAGAVQHFENAVHMEPANGNAKLFLANALLKQFFSEKPDPNRSLLIQARDQYQAVLTLDPQNRRALQGMMTVGIHMGQTAAARDWALKLIQVDHTDKGAYAAVGTLDWAILYADYMRAKQASGGKTEIYFLPDANARLSLRNQHAARLEEGMQMLRNAIQLDSQYDDAMAYLNLLYRLKAGMAESSEQADNFIREADEWVHRALDTKKARAKATAPAPPALDVNGPPPGPVDNPAGMVAAPPPPPLPPGNQLASAEAPPRARNPAEAPLAFVQVVASSPMPAMLLFQELKGKGFPTSMIRPQDNLTRVMVGPYANDKAIADAKQKLEALGFKPLRVW